MAEVVRQVLEELVQCDCGGLVRITWLRGTCGECGEEYEALGPRFRRQLKSIRNLPEREE